MKKAIVEINWNFKAEFERVSEAVSFAVCALDHSDRDSIEIRIEKIPEHNEENLEQNESEVIEDESGDPETV